MKLVAPFAAALAIAACNGGGPTALPNAAQAPSQSQRIPDWQRDHSAVAACPGDRWHGKMQCDVLVNRLGGMSPDVAGLGPADFQKRYKLPSSTKGAGQIVAIVDAFDNPNVANDLGVYRSNFGLGTANFTKYNQTGQTSNYPQGNTGWGVEIDLDVEMVSASCPKCTIYLIEANSNNTSDLYAAVKEAVTLGAKVVSNSYGGGGGGGSGNAFNTPGIVYLASSGDGGYGMQDPADYQTVVSIGGTTLIKSGSSYTENIWRDSGGGCSVVSKPSWQHDPGCNKRTGNEVSAVAAGVAVYDTYGNGGWGTVGGTSVSSPLLAGVYGLAGNAASHTTGKPFWTLKKKKLKKDLHAITTGNNGTCGGSYLCTAGTNQFGTYSGPGGFGTPNGIGAF
jgi:subtilase family serine protease